MDYLTIVFSVSEVALTVGIFTFGLYKFGGYYASSSNE